MSNKILIVDDERTIIQYVFEILRDLGYQSEFIPRSDLIFHRLEKEFYDLILLDIYMPGTDGITLLEQLKKHDEYKEIPVIMMTGDSNGEILELCLNGGAADFINKPIKEPVLKARVKSVLDKQRYIQEVNDQHDVMKTQNYNIRQSINYASKIQLAMLPRYDTIAQYLKDFFVYYKPKDIVSGDFYWFSEFNEKIIIAAVDCTGHGVPGAFMSMLGGAYLNNIIMNMQNCEPNNILNALHENIRKSLQQDKIRNQDGMDMSLCVIDRKKKIMEFAAAHNELAYISNGTYNLIRGDRFPIGGITKDRSYNKYTIKYNSKTVFYIYSDGYTDQFSKDGKIKFNKKRFRDLLMDIHKMPMYKQKEILEEKHELWKGDAEQIDDILIFGFIIG